MKKQRFTHPIGAACTKTVRSSEFFQHIGTALNKSPGRQPRAAFYNPIFYWRLAIAIRNLS